jgi:hypothetical protein
VTPYTHEIPTQARENFLNNIRSGLYEDFGVLDVHAVAAGATNDHIDASYQPMDEEADDFEYQVIQFIQQILSLMGVEDVPQFKRNRISNQKEQSEMIIMAAQYLDDKTVPEATKETVADIGSYVLGSAAGLGLGKGAGRLMSLVREPARRIFGGVSAGQKGLTQLMEGGKGTRTQVVKATRDALEGKKAPIVSSNPYRKDAEKLVNDLDMTATQKNKAKRILEDYLDKGDIEKVSSKAESATVSKKIGKNFDKEVEAEAKRIGKQATTETMERKLDFDGIAKNLTDEERNDLLLRLRSSGLRTDEGAPAFVGVSEITTENPNAARAVAESEVIAKWLDENKTARNKVFSSEAAEKVLKGYGKQADTKTRRLLKFVTEEPVLYEGFKKEPNKAIVKSAQNVAPKSASRRFSPVLYEHYDFEDREGKK